MQIIKGPTSNPKLPEIYQIEVASACNLKCEFCPREHPTKLRPATSEMLLDMDLFNKIVERDLGGSYFIELQQSGEPTLHPYLGEIVTALNRKGILTGLSTHGGLINRKLEELLLLDYLTISFDAGEKELYERLRKRGIYSLLIQNIDLICKEKKKRGLSKPVIDLQIIEFADFESQVTLAQELVKTKGWDVNIRTVKDSFRGVYDKSVKVDCTELCLNPWLSVSIQCDGDVVPCCMSFGKEVVYGNLKEASLLEIWNESPVLELFRQQHLNGMLPELCSSCYARSPAMFHMQLIKKALLGSKR